MIVTDMEKSNVIVETLAFLPFNNREMTTFSALGCFSVSSQRKKEKKQRSLYTVDKDGCDNISSRSRREITLAKADRRCVQKKIKDRSSSGETLDNPLSQEMRDQESEDRAQIPCQ